MAADYSIIANQTVQPNQPVAFLDAPCPCNQGYIFKKGAGTFLLASNAPRNNSCNCGCCCRKLYSTDYGVEAHLNVLIPTDGTVEEIRFGLVVDGVIDTDSVMLATPAAVEVAENIGTGIVVSVPSICGCDSIALVNLSTQPVTVVNGNMKFDYEGVRRIR